MERDGGRDDDGGRDEGMTIAGTDVWGGFISLSGPKARLINVGKNKRPS